MELDENLVKVYNENLLNQEAFLKTGIINATGHESQTIDLIMEKTLIDFFKQKKFPCTIESEEQGKIALSDDPKFLVITDPLDGSNNFSRRIPLTCYGVAIAKLDNNSSIAKFSDIEVAAVRSFHTKEFFIAKKTNGATCNDQIIKPSKKTKLNEALISFDLDRTYSKSNFIEKILPILQKCKGTRRFGANLLDMVYVGAGKLEAMIDIRNLLSVVHVASLFISKESGAFLRTFNDEEFDIELATDKKMSFILCNNEKMFRQIFETIR